MIVAAAVVTVAACGPVQNGRVDNAGPPAAAVSADTRVTMERLPCFGTCPVYIVDLTGDGAVTFTGERFVDSVGTYTAAIDAGAFAALVQELVAQGFFDFADRYTHDTRECGSYHTDAPGAVLTVRTEGRSKRVVHDYGCGGAPAALRELHERVDSVAGVQRWIGRR